MPAKIKTIDIKLIAEIDIITKRYEELFAREDDIKALQGMERCVELKMKICGFDGKPLPTPPTTDRVVEPSISLAELPTSVLKQLLNSINN